MMLVWGSPALPVALSRKGYSVGFFREPTGLLHHSETALPHTVILFDLSSLSCNGGASVLCQYVLLGLSCSLTYMH